MKPDELSQIKAELKSLMDKRLADGEVVKAFDAFAVDASKTLSSGSLAAVPRAVLCTIFAFMVYERHGRVPSKKVEKLMTFADSLEAIMHHGVPKAIRSILLSDFFLAKSQMLRRLGMPWQALWTLQQMNSMEPANYEYEIRGLQGMVSRALRVGMFRLAYEHAVRMETVAHQDLPRRSIARLFRVHILRLQGKVRETKALIEDTHALIGAEFAADLAWEGFCLHLSKTGDASPMIDAVRPKGSHFSGTYPVEAKLWTLLSSNRATVSALPKLATLGRTLDVKSNRLGTFFQVAAKVEALYEDETPDEIKVNGIGPMIEAAAGLITLDKELVTLAGLIIWLIREQSSIAKTLLEVYNLRLGGIPYANGADPLGVLPDKLFRRVFP